MRAICLTPPWPSIASTPAPFRRCLGLHTANLTTQNADKPLKGHFVTTNYFSELGVPVLLGRRLDPVRDGAPGADPVAVLSHGFWQRHYGSDRGIVGQSIRLNRQSATIVGVAGPNFGGLSASPVDLWLPIEQQPHFISGSHLLTSFNPDTAQVILWGRMRQGVTPKIVEAELEQLAGELRKLHPKEVWEKERVAAEPGAYVRMNGGRGTGTPMSQRQKLYPIFLIIGSLVSRFWWWPAATWAACY